MKAILMLDMPDKCSDCPLRYYSEEVDIYRCCLTNRQADWLIGREEECPLKPIAFANKLEQIATYLYEQTIKDNLE